jgi:hypothetical protein
MRFTSFVVIAAFVAPILAGPVALKTVETAKERVEGRYIVTLKPTVKQSTHIDRLQSKFRGNAMIVHAQWDPKFLNGFAAKLSTEALNDLRAHPDVASISEDGIAHAFATGIQVRTSMVSGSRNSAKLTMCDRLTPLGVSGASVIATRCGLAPTPMPSLIRTTTTLMAVGSTFMSSIPGSTLITRLSVAVLAGFVMLFLSGTRFDTDCSAY